MPGDPGAEQRAGRGAQVPGQALSCLGGAERVTHSLAASRARGMLEDLPTAQLCELSKCLASV